MITDSLKKIESLKNIPGTQMEQIERNLRIQNVVEKRKMLFSFVALKKLLR